MRVALKDTGHVRGNGVVQVQPFLMPGVSRHLESLVHHVFEIERCVFEHHFVRFDLAQVKDVVDEAEQGVARFQQDTDVSALVVV